MPSGTLGLGCRDAPCPGRCQKTLRGGDLSSLPQPRVPRQRERAAPRASAQQTELRPGLKASDLLPGRKASARVLGSNGETGAAPSCGLSPADRACLGASFAACLLGGAGVADTLAAETRGTGRSHPIPAQGPGTQRPRRRGRGPSYEAPRPPPEADASRSRQLPGTPAPAGSLPSPSERRHLWFHKWRRWGSASGGVSGAAAGSAARCAQAAPFSSRQTFAGRRGDRSGLRKASGQRCVLQGLPTCKGPRERTLGLGAAGPPGPQVRCHTESAEDRTTC